MGNSQQKGDAVLGFRTWHLPHLICQLKGGQFHLQSTCPHNPTFFFFFPICITLWFHLNGMIRFLNFSIKISPVFVILCLHQPLLRKTVLLLKNKDATGILWTDCLRPITLKAQAPLQSILFSCYSKLLIFTCGHI